MPEEIFRKLKVSIKRNAMITKKYNFVELSDILGYLVVFGMLPFILSRRFIIPALEPYDLLSAISYSFFIINYFIGFLYFYPKLAAITEVRGREIRYFNAFGSATRWAPISHYRYIADGPDIKKVKVYKQNCKKIGTIPLKSAKPEEKREFLAHIEPWLIVRGGDSPVQEDCNKGSE